MAEGSAGSGSFYNLRLYIRDSTSNLYFEGLVKAYSWRHQSKEALFHKLGVLGIREIFTSAAVQKLSGWATSSA